MGEKIKRWYCLGLWTASMVHTAAAKGLLTRQEADEILEMGGE